MWVQTVCKSYQHTTLGDKELKYVTTDHILNNQYVTTTFAPGQESTANIINLNSVIKEVNRTNNQQ